MNCAEIEILICDYVDGTLAPADRAELERHLAACTACAELARDSRAALGFIERASEIEPPPELITRILFDAPWTKHKSRPSGALAWLKGFCGPVLRPKFVMGAAMTILSFSMFTRFVTPIRQLKPSDLKPSEVWASIESRADRTWARTVKYYENLKIVYQIQTLLRDYQQQVDEQKPAPADQRKTDDRKLPVKASTPEGAPTSKPQGGSR
ncbi:MAG TPA: anti-sigma factor [Candidatus Acidoferrales bacterium]|nr:anti-sigma factor [Candidatus Acidoferrales bacterium]